MSDEDLERADDLCQRDALVGLPLLRRLHVVNEDDEVILLALVVALDLLRFSASHDCVVSWGARLCVWMSLG